MERVRQKGKNREKGKNKDNEGAERGANYDFLAPRIFSHRDHNFVGAHFEVQEEDLVGVLTVLFFLFDDLWTRSHWSDSF